MKIGFLGDICLGAPVVSNVSSQEERYPFGGVGDELGKLDLGVGNLECCIPEDSCGSDGGSFFAASPEMLDRARRAGIGLMSLANNHVLDCGEEGLSATLESLDAAGIGHFGAGENSDQASAVRWLEWAGRRLAFIGACDRSSCFAGPEKAGVQPSQRRWLGPSVREAVRSADLVTVTLHADFEFVRSPAPWRMRFCRWLIDQGAHLVICHHPHVLQGVEEYGGGLIAYSLGNFVFPVVGNAYQETRAQARDSMILTVDLDFEAKGGPLISWDPIPVRISEHHEPVGLSSPVAQQRREEFEGLSRGLGPVTVRKKWRAVCLHQALREARGIYYPLRRGHVREGLRRARQTLAESENWPWILGCLTVGYR